MIINPYNDDPKNQIYTVSCEGCGFSRVLTALQSVLYRLGLYPIYCYGCKELKAGNKHRHPNMYNFIKGWQ